MADIKTVGIVGLGMIGGSLGLGLSGAGYCALGYDIDDEVQNIALEKGCICAPISDFSALDALIIALTEGNTLSALEKYVPQMKAGATVLDICGNKRAVAGCMQALRQEYPQIHFVGTHPMAGRETDGKSFGILKATRRLFEDAYAVVVPIAGDEEGVAVARELYGALGVRGVKLASAETHDRMISYTSQLAHILSSAYVKNAKAATHQGFSAGSFLDLSRVSRLDARMWTELFLNNGDELKADIDLLIENLAAYRDALLGGDGERLERLLEEGNAYKDAADKNARARREDV